MRLLNKTKDTEDGMPEGPTPFDPSELEDSVAQETEWGALEQGGISLGTHAYKQVSAHRAAFQGTLIGLLIPLIGMLLSLWFAVSNVKRGIADDELVIVFVGIVFGSPIFILGLLMGFGWMTPRVFDKQRGQHWVGYRRPSRDKRKAEEADERTHCSLEEIYAIQVIRENLHTRSGGRSGGTGYKSYEINLVLNDGSRMNVVDHGKLSLIKHDAKSLADFLGVPCWDASQTTQ